MSGYLYSDIRSSSYDGQDRDDAEVIGPEFVQVYLRVKPCAVPSGVYRIESDTSLITTVDTATMGHSRRNYQNGPKMYTFNHIFGPESQQKDIFERVVKHNLGKLLDGQNFILLTYGASGSGKTYTLMGNVAAPGIVPRSLEYLFQIIDAAQYPEYKPTDSGAERLDPYQQSRELQWIKSLREVASSQREKYRRMSVQLLNSRSTSSLNISNKVKHYVWVSFIEIYNESIYDLLGNCDRRATSKLRIREDSKGNAFVQGARQAFVRSGQEAYEVLVAGKHNRQVAATGIHAHSSRSHCIFTITLVTDTENGIRTSTVRLCDLAGSERASRTKNTGTRMQESRAINSSLHVLERCLQMLRQKQLNPSDSKIIPYRESKLTRLMGDGLSGTRAAAVSMLVTVTPAAEYVQESRHVLALATVATDIQVNYTASDLTSLESSSQDYTLAACKDCAHLRTENERLEFELARAQNEIMKLNIIDEQNREKTFKDKKDVAEEAKRIIKAFYVEQIELLQQKHRSEIEDLVEEYEEKLSKKQVRSSDNNHAKYEELQEKFKLLESENALLKDDLTQERLARTTLEEELIQLQAHLREETAKNKKTMDVIQLSDSESDSSSDIDPNESLEPTFSNKDILNYSKLRLSLAFDNQIEEQDESVEKDNDDINDKEKNAVLKKNTSIIVDCDVKNNAINDSGHSGNDSQCIFEEEDDLIANTEETRQLLNNTNILNTSNDRIKSDEQTHKVAHANDVKNISNTQPLFSETNVENVMVDETEKKDNDIDTSHTLDTTHSAVINNKESDIFLASGIELDTNQSCCSDNLRLGWSRITDVDDSFKALKAVETASNKNRGTYCINSHKIETIPKHIEVNIKLEPSSLESGFNTETKDKSGITQLKAAETEQVKTHNDLLKDNVPFDKEHLNIVPTAEIKKPKETLIYTDDTQNKIPELITSKPFDKVPVEQSKCKTIAELIAVSSKSTHSSPDTDQSLAQFEALEQAVNVTDTKTSTNPILLNMINTIKKKHYVMGIPKSNINLEQLDTNRDDKQISSIVADNVTKDCMPITNIKLPQENISKTTYIPALETVIPRKHGSAVDSNDHESPILTCIKPNSNKKRSIEPIEVYEKLVLDQNEKQLTAPLKDNTIISKQYKHEAIFDFAIPENKPIESETCVTNNTTYEFDNIHNNVSSRPSEFDLLFPKETNVTNPTENIVHNDNENQLLNETAKVKKRGKYNLRHKGPEDNANHIEDEIVDDDVIVAKTKKSLRLRRRKDKVDDQKEREQLPAVKLKDIVNLQAEFADVTLDVPVIQKTVKDIPSPERSAGQEENLPPYEAQSCPSKSVTRSRRKLFTPRAEPLEESPTKTGDSNEKIRVPRPSYHRTRVRRKLPYQTQEGAI